MVGADLEGSRVNGVDPDGHSGAGTQVTCSGRPRAREPVVLLPKDHTMETTLLTFCCVECDHTWSFGPAHGVEVLCPSGTCAL
jgi:hypothetical protein